MSDIFDIILGDAYNPDIYPKRSYDVALFDPPFVRPYTPRSDRYPGFEPLDVDRFVSTGEAIYSRLKPSGWLIFKCDAATLLALHPLLHKFKFYKEAVWDKNFLGPGSRIRRRHELIAFYYKDKPYWNRPLQSILRHQYRQAGMLGARDVEHVNQTPPELWIEILSATCPDGGYVLDPFMGSGSVGVACARLGLHYTGIEINPEIFSKAKRRLERCPSFPRLISSYLS